MPFEQCVPRNFSNSEIRKFAPQLAGVYGISNPREWVFIGVSDNIQHSLLQHLDSPSNPKATGFVYELCDGPRQLSRQTRLKLEYKPSGNVQGSR